MGMKPFAGSEVNGKSKKTGIISALAFCFLLFIYAPLEIYWANCQDFYFDIYILLPYVFGLFSTGFAVCVCLVLFSSAFSNRLVFIECICWTFLTVFFLILGLFFSDSLPILDGSRIDWSSFAQQRIIGYCIFLSLIVFTIIALKSKADSIILFGGINIALAVFLFLSLVLTGVTTCGAFDRKDDVSITYDHVLDMSEENSIAIVVLDCIDSVTFNKLIDEHPEYKNAFRDFTFYPDTVSVFDHTAHSLIQFLTGEQYFNQEPYWEFFSDAVDKSELFRILKEKNYSIGLYSELFTGVKNSPEYTDNLVYSDGPANPKDFCSMILHLVGLKYLPYDFKPYCVLSPENIAHDSYTGNGDYSWENRFFYDYIKNRSVTVTDSPNFRLIHIKGGHPDYYYNANLEPDDDADYKDAILSSMLTVEAYLDKLKEAGVYDCSDIIIMADHGSYESGINKSFPLFMIKRVGEKHEFKKTELPVSYQDLPHILIDMVNGCDNDGAIATHEGQKRIIYRVGHDKITEYCVLGQCGDPDSYLETGKVYNDIYSSP